MGRDLIMASMAMARIVSRVGLRRSVAMGVSARGSLPKSARILWSFGWVGWDIFGCMVLGIFCGIQ